MRFDYVPAVAAEWMQDAVCASVDPALFFLEPGGRGALTAQKICNACPVQAECLDYAVENDERWGIWAGTNERERRKMRHERGYVDTEEIEDVA